MIFEIPEKFPNFSQSFKGVVDRGVLFPSRLVFIHCIITLVYTKFCYISSNQFLDFSTQTEPEQNSTYF